MGVSDKFEAGMDKAKGKIKETVGDKTNDEKMATEGKFDQAKGDLKNAAEKAKDAVKDVFE